MHEKSAIAKSLIDAGLPESVRKAVETILEPHLMQTDRVQSFSHVDKRPRTTAEIARHFHRCSLKKIDLLGDLAADAAWQMLLALLSEDDRKRYLSVSSLCHGSGVPATTALRHIQAMIDKGLITKRPDMRDGRRTLIELTEATRTLLSSTLLTFCVIRPSNPF